VTWKSRRQTSRSVDASALREIALGAAILGAGGGGDPYVGRLLARASIARDGPVRLVEAATLADDDVVVAVGMIGAPTVLSEKIPAGDEFARAVRKLEQHLGRKVTHIVPEEVGGTNSMMPIAAAAQLGLPLVDGDLMGRAFPEIQMCSPTLSGISCTPMALSDDKGNRCVVDGVTNLWAERLARAITIQMGCAAAMALYPMTGAQVHESVILGSLTRAWRLGTALEHARAHHEDPTARVAADLDGRVLLTGKVVDVARKIKRGFTTAEIDIEGLGDDAGRLMHLSTQNEHLIASIDGDVVATVPDLIVVLESELGNPVLTERIRYGLRVAVIGAPCDARWRTPLGLETTGPRYFGYDLDFRPVEA
jgi:DUF917 family protein